MFATFSSFEIQVDFEQKYSNKLSKKTLGKDNLVKKILLIRIKGIRGKPRETKETQLKEGSRILKGAHKRSKKAQIGWKGLKGAQNGS